MDQLSATIQKIQPIDPSWIARAESRQLQLTKPPGSLGRLEEIACRLSAIQQTLSPNIDRRRIVIFAADHGVTAEGVSPYPSEVTAQMVENFRTGGAAINAIARSTGAEIRVIDIGVVGPVNESSEGLHVKVSSRKIRPGTRNMAAGPAMTEEEMLAALQIGIETAREAKEEGANVIGLGEMGIGNTTAASAITAALTGLPPASITGRGAGADDATLRRKIQTIERALALNAPDPKNPLDILCKVGGLEIAGLCGLCLGAAEARLAIVTDGFIATSGAALAVRLCPAVRDYLFAAHLSTEPGHAALLELIGVRPLLDLEMRLGEGAGAALSLGIIAAAVAAFTGMATFESAGVADKDTQQQTASR
jgi:nicotinate-nucleotide--dimethylbenzimidazole phosphoribosyltransferase